MSIAISSLVLIISGRTVQSFSRKNTKLWHSIPSTATLSSAAFVHNYRAKHFDEFLRREPSDSMHVSNIQQEHYSSTSTSALEVLKSPITTELKSKSKSQNIKPLQSTNPSAQPPLQVNLLTIHQPELETLLSQWNQPKYRAKQILEWVRNRGVTSFDEMNNIPNKLKSILEQHTTIGSLKLDVEAVSKDGTRKRAYRLHDGQLIESVLMPYQDGRNTACISSQAGCAMGCVFCATGQMGFARQLTPDEIYEQVARFDAELKKDGERLSVSALFLYVNYIYH